MKIVNVVGARPNFMKIAPLMRAYDNYKDLITPVLVHTGQHYDKAMSKVFFDELDIPRPDINLGVGSGSHGEQTARIIIEFERLIHKEKPDIVLVVGDVNSTLACSITAKKMNIKVAHVEAGLRSGDLSMPEEINRIVTDSISDYLFVTERSGVENLIKEGKDESQIFFVGNIMIDSLYHSINKVKTRLNPCLASSNYAVVTLHRPSNVDHKNQLENILLALYEISKDMDIYFPVHPRTEKNIKNFNLNHLLKNIKTMPPLSYLDFLVLWKDASLVLTDSGGIQEETTALGIPCFTIRENTERPITIIEGTNQLVGCTCDGILKAWQKFMANGIRSGKIPELWDGKTAQRIIQALLRQN